MKIAIIGSGIAGNVAAYHLHREHDITVFEAGAHIGGHTHTHCVEHEGCRVSVDTGFIVFNERTYPRFMQLLRELDVGWQPSDMSFSVKCLASGLEYNGTSLNRLFAQRRNLLRPSFWRMIADIVRFNREAPAVLSATEGRLPLRDYLENGGYSDDFIARYIVPMGAAIWSCGTQSLLDFPTDFFVRFFHNHGMLSVDDRPQWLTIRGGSARYVEKLVAPFRDRILTRARVERVRRTPQGVQVCVAGADPLRFDRVFFACHSDQVLEVLADVTPAEYATLAAIRYTRNEALLHTDTSVLPRRTLARAAWNYRIDGRAAERVAVTYDMKLLQRLPVRTPLLVSLNMGGDIDPRKVIERVEYAHPVYTRESVAAQARQVQINGANRAYFCGAYWGHGFHEDGVVSALQALEHFRQREYAQLALPRSA